MFASQVANLLDVHQRAVLQSIMELQNSKAAFFKQRSCPLVSYLFFQQFYSDSQATMGAEILPQFIHGKF